MRIKYIAFIALAISTIGLQNSHAEEGSGNLQCSSLTAVDSSMSIADITGMLAGSSDMASIIGSVAMNNEELLGDVLGYVAANNPESLLEAMRVVKKCSSSLAVSTLATISQLLADNTELLQRIQDDNPELIAQIMDGNVDILPAAGPRDRESVRNRAQDRLQLRRAAAENARQSSPN